MFWMYVVELSASAHSICGRDFTCSMQDAISFRDLFFLLSDFVSLWSIGNYVLQLNPYLMENIMDLVIYIISPVISSEDFHLLFGLCLNQGFEIFEVLTDLKCFPEKVNPCKM
jgi:hypothetical protein